MSTLTVTNTDDSGPGSLRDAIAAADSGSGAEKIVFAPSVTGTIRLTSGPLTITHSLEIDGPGAGRLAVSGRGASRVFVIEGGSYGGAGVVTIKDLTIEDGLATSDLDFPASGGGVLDLMAGLTLDGCALDSNQAPLGGAGAMIYRGALTASNSTWSNNVIIGNPGSSTVGSDTLSPAGSGVDAYASSAKYESCTFTANIPLNAGVGTLGGGISGEEGSTLDVWGSTFVGNQSSQGGGIWAEDGSTVTVTGSAFDGNRVGYFGGGGGIAVSQTELNVHDCSFTDDSAPFTGGAIDDVSTSLTSIPQLNVTASRFVGNQTGYSGGAIDLLGVSGRIADSLFSANQVSGGGGFSLAEGGAIAAMYSPSPLNPDQTLPLTLDGDTFVNNQALLPEDLGPAQGGAIWDQIAMTVVGGTFSGNSAEGLTGQGGAIADDTGTAVTIARSSFDGNQAVGLGTGASGGAIYTNLQPEVPQPTPTTTTIADCSFTDNTANGGGATGAGGAIADQAGWPAASGSSLAISGSVFSGNQALGGGPFEGFALGGAIDSPSRPLSITSTSFLGNQAIGTNAAAGVSLPGAQAFGGAVVASGSSVTFLDSQFLGNVARGGDSDSGGGNAAGGALLLAFQGTTTARIGQSAFLDNLAEDGFGGVGVSFPLAASGGAIGDFSGSLDLSDVAVVGNEAFGGDGPPGSVANGAQGGGIFNLVATLSMTDCTVTGNLSLGGRGGEAPQGGGAAGAGGDAKGGGVFNFGTLTMSDSLVAGNAAVGGAGGAASGGTGGPGGNAYGGGIGMVQSPYYPPESIDIEDCIVTGNRAIGGAGGAGTTNGAGGQGLGGGIAILGGSATIGKKTKVFGNLASTADDNIYTAPDP